MAASYKTCPVAAVEGQIKSIFRRWGMPEPAVEASAAVMLWADLRGVDSHGISMIPALYARLRDEGAIEIAPEVRVVRDGPAIATVDGGGGLGHYPAVIAMRLAIEKAAKIGIAAVTVRNSHHYGAAGYYAALAAEAGLIGLSTTGVFSPSVVPTFAAQAMFGTNPIAFAAPAGRNRPFLLDMATSTIAMGKITLAARAGKPLAEGWALNQEGRPETDARVAYDARMMTPLGSSRELGSHKGYGLAAMVEILSTTLAGARFAALHDKPPPDHHDVGHFFLAMDPGAFRDAGDFRADLDAMIDGLHQARPADAAQPVLVAGDPEADETERRKRDGIPLNRVLIDEVAAIAARAGANFLL